MSRPLVAPALAAAVLSCGLPPSVRAEGPARPRLLIAARDPFSGLPALKARYAAGARPSDESMDYMRINWAPLALMAELRRTTAGDDPARRDGLFRSMGPTYLYKVLPDGSTARDDDNGRLRVRRVGAARSER